MRQPMDREQEAAIQVLREAGFVPGGQAWWRQRFAKPGSKRRRKYCFVTAIAGERRGQNCEFPIIVKYSPVHSLAPGASAQQITGTQVRPARQ
jgi:hypothetical protein